MTRYFFIGVILLYATGVAHASPITLVSGKTVTVLGTSTPFSSNNVTVASDGNLATGFSFTSTFGVPISTQIFGFNQTYEFDISRFSGIQSIAFTWSGRYTWVGNLPFLGLRIAPQPAFATAQIEGFGSGSTPNNSVQTGSLFVFAGDGATNFRNNLALSLVSPGLAQFNIETEFGLSTSQTPQTPSSLTLETLEVTADVLGTPVPEPITLLLWGTTAAGLGLARWRRRRQN